MISRTREKCIIVDVNYRSLDMTIVEKFKKGLLNIYLSSMYSDIILNLTKVTYIDAAGLEALLFAGILAQEAGGRFSMFGVNNYVKQILLQTRLYRYFDINKTEEEALEFIKDSEFATICNYQQLRHRLVLQSA